MKNDFSDLFRGVDEIIIDTELKKALGGDRKLRIKLGVDPSRPDIHLGHAVPLRILRRLQDKGHTIIFLIGDATARIGDPSGRNKTRPVLTDAEIKANAKTYMDQVGKILDKDKAELRYNSEWLDKLSFTDLLKLASNFTVAQLIEREDFKTRLDSGQELVLHEMLYPVMQAYDSVMLKADVEFGGTDQRFNNLAGRSLQKKLGQRPQQVVLTKLLVGLDGVNKMSKSLDNYIGITDAPLDMYGKVMSIPDNLIAPYYELCTDIELGVIDELVKTLADGANPRDSKASLAREIVTIYHGAKEAIAAEEAWNNQFRDGQRPTDIESKTVKSKKLVDALVELGLAPSNSDARRLLEQNGVKINDVVADQTTGFASGDIIQVGKRRFVQVK
jgi:tyrosyl-tRNA synthetase